MFPISFSYFLVFLNKFNMVEFLVLLLVIWKCKKKPMLIIERILMDSSSVRIIKYSFITFFSRNAKWLYALKI